MIGKISFGQEITVVKGQLSNEKIENISLQCDENPFSGAREEFEAVLLDSINFEFHVEMFTSGTYKLIINNNAICNIFLCPGQNLSISIDSNGFKYIGSTKDFQEWNQVLYRILNKYSFENYENNGLDISNTLKTINNLFEQKKLNEEQINKIATDFTLDSCEYEYCKYRNEYAIYTFIWSELLQKGYSIESDVYNFFEKLPLDDMDAANSSLDYNRAISIYLFIKLRLDNGWFKSNSFDFSSEEFNTLFYNKILAELQNEDVRNITLTRKVISLLSSGSSSAESLTKKYFTDCTNSYYKTITYKYYNDYLNQMTASQENPDIKRLSEKLLDELNNYKGQVVYLDFWASWCSPCRASIPFTKELQSKYKDQAFQVVYVNIDDNYGQFETTAKKLGLNKNLIYLNKEQSTEIRKQLAIKGIPQYVLVNKSGLIVTTDAPAPNSFAVVQKINELLSE